MFKPMRLKFNLANLLLLLAGFGAFATGVFSVVTESVGSGFGRHATAVTLYKEDGAGSYWFAVVIWFASGIWFTCLALMSAREEFDSAGESLVDGARRRARELEMKRSNDD